MKKPIVVAIALVVGALHFIVGPHYRGPFPAFVNGYLIDLLLPFSMYLLMGLVKHPRLRPPPVRALMVFGVGATVETLQYFGVPILGRTFDPLDFAMYAVGVLAGIAFEAAVFRSIFSTRPRP